jgi:hypothetical protein
MNCPNCGAEKMRSTETFQLADETVRTKQCRECKWTYTTRETISDDVVIPAAVRNMKSKRKPVPQSSLPQPVQTSPSQMSPK